MAGLPHATAPHVQAFTEVCQHDQHCQRQSCDAVLKAGAFRYYVLSDIQGIGRWVCRDCHAYYENKARTLLLPLSSTPLVIMDTLGNQATTMRRIERSCAASMQDSERNQNNNGIQRGGNVDTNSIRIMVNAAQRKGQTAYNPICQMLT